MSKHTAGPWETEHYHTERDSNEPGYYAIAPAVLDHHRGSVADTLNRDHRISPDEDEANARLIAAAPELFEALTAICNTWGEPANKPGPSLDSLMEIGRAAIAKATAVRP